MEKRGRIPLAVVESVPGHVAITEGAGKRPSDRGRVSVDSVALTMSF